MIYKLTVKTLRSQWPSWLRQARTVDARVHITDDGRVVWLSGTWLDGTWLDGIWHGGVWRSGVWRGGVWLSGTWLDGTWRGGDWHEGEWRGGTWRGGTWLDGDWRGGDWRSGTWHGGVWRGGTWLNGIWRGGVWHDGDWRDGIWHGGVWHAGTWRGGEWRDGRWLGGTWCRGTWHAPEDRLRYMASLAGLSWDGTHYIGYRTTQADGRGRFTRSFVQTEGEYYESDLPPSGAGTCVPGIHITSAARAWAYFGVDQNAQLWEVRVRPDDLLDCDGEKARIRGGIFRKINRPF